MLAYVMAVLIIILVLSLFLTYLLKRNNLLNYVMLIGVVAGSAIISIMFPFILNLLLNISTINFYTAIFLAFLIFITLLAIFAYAISQLVYNGNFKVIMYFKNIYQGRLTKEYATTSIGDYINDNMDENKNYSDIGEPQKTGVPDENLLQENVEALEDVQASDCREADELAVSEEVELIEEIGVIEEIELVDEIEHIAEVELTEEIGAVEEVEVDEEIKEIEEINEADILAEQPEAANQQEIDDLVSDEAELIEEIELVEEIESVEEIELVEEDELTKEIELVEEVELTEEIGAIEEIEVEEEVKEIEEIDEADMPEEQPETTDQHENAEQPETADQPETEEVEKAQEQEADGSSDNAAAIDQNIENVMAENNVIESFDKETPDSDKKPLTLSVNIDEIIEEMFVGKQNGDLEGALALCFRIMDQKPQNSLVFWLVPEICLLLKQLGQQDFARFVLNDYANRYSDLIKANEIFDFI